MQFGQALAEVLPVDVPQREKLIAKADEHLQMILLANEYMNLTRITNEREAAIKHVYDCVAVWPFFEKAQTVMDAGSGAGFPGIPLAVIFPGTRFLLAESTQKKARFLQEVAGALGLENVEIYGERAEQIAERLKPDVITARAVAPLDRLLLLFKPMLKKGTPLLFYKGPDVDRELDTVRSQLVQGTVIQRYDLPEEMGSRTLVRLNKRR